MANVFTTLLRKARRGKYAVGAFNINNLEITQAIINAANEMRSPVILSTSEGAINYAGMEYLAAMVRVAKDQSQVPVVFHLDHGKNVELVKAAIRSGWYDSVMIDASSLPFKKNVHVTRSIVKMAHKKGIAVEAELGAIPGKEDLVDVKNKDAFFTDVDQAAEFVRMTGCDALAVSVGTAHGAFKATGIAGSLDLKRLRAIADTVEVPLVLHGASRVCKKLLNRLHGKCSVLKDCDWMRDAHGIATPQKKRAIALGVAKINIDTDLRLAFTVGLRETLLKDNRSIDPRKLLVKSKTMITDEVKKHIRIHGSEGKA